MNRQTLILCCVLILCLLLGMLFIRHRDETMQREATEAAERKTKEEAFIAKALQDQREHFAREDAELRIKLQAIKDEAALAKLRYEAASRRAAFETEQAIEDIKFQFRQK
jgi:hypothetical protein